MSKFDFLIDKGLKPKPIEYIYMLDIVWRPNIPGEVQIKRGSIVTDVVQQESGRYDFTVKETGMKCTCAYAWALAENTEENNKAIAEYEEHNIFFKEIERLNKFLWNKIVTLKNSK